MLRKGWVPTIITKISFVVALQTSRLSYRLTLSTLISVDTISDISHVLGPSLLIVAVQFGTHLPLRIQIISTWAPDLEPRNDDLCFVLLVGRLSIWKPLFKASNQKLLLQHVEVIAAVSPICGKLVSYAGEVLLEQQWRIGLRLSDVHYKDIVNRWVSLRRAEGLEQQSGGCYWWKDIFIWKWISDCCWKLDCSWWLCRTPGKLSLAFFLVIVKVGTRLYSIKEKCNEIVTIEKGTCLPLIASLASFSISKSQSVSLDPFELLPFSFSSSRISSFRSTFFTICEFGLDSLNTCSSRLGSRSSASSSQGKV